MNNIIKLVHHNDGKQKFQSHEIYLKEGDFYNPEYDLHTHNLFEVYGCGETKEDALNDFKRKMDYLFNEYKALEQILFETNWLTDNIVEVDCFGKEKNK